MNNNKDKRIVFIFVEAIILFLIINNFFNIALVPAIIINIILIFFMFVFYWFFYYNKVNNGIGNFFMSKRLNDSIETNIDYFREIINKYSIGELCFLDGYDINIPKDLIAIILKLKLKKVIDIIDDKIVVNNYKVDLKESEKYLLNSICDGKIVLKDDLELKKIVKQELVNDKILMNKSNNSSFRNKLLLFVVIGFIVLMLSLLVISKFNLEFTLEDNLIKIITILFFVLLFISIVISIIESVGHNFSIKLTEEGKEIKVRLNGLKNYLQEFSVIDKRKIDELLLYEDYLIYSVMFNLNKDIIDSYKNLIVIKEELYLEEK